MYTYIYIYTYTHTHIVTYNTHTYIHTHMHMHTSTNTHTCIHTCAHTYTHAPTHHFVLYFILAWFSYCQIYDFEFKRYMILYYDIYHFQRSRMAKALIILFLTATVLSILLQVVLFAECRSVSILILFKYM